jgi:hypothetical protein
LEEIMQNFDIAAVARAALILGHLLAFAVAAASVALGDFALFGHRRINSALLEKAARGVIAALVALWITGLCVIWIDTRFTLSVLMHADKLLAKLTVVTLLTLNGFALHLLAFPRFHKPQNDPEQAAVLPTMLGTFSAVSWLFAAFLGIAKALAPLLGYTGFMILYLVAVCAATAIGMAVIRPQLARRMGRAGRLNATPHSVRLPATRQASAAL